MIGIQIKIAGEWIELPDDFSISLEQSSPLFNDEGVFSFPFEIPLGPNRRIFKNISDPFGDITLSDIDRMEAEVWFDGVMLYRGIIETDEEVEFENTNQGTVPVTFLSGNSDFKTLIEGMNARDIPLDREIKLGYVVKYAFCTLSTNDNRTGFVRINFPSGDVMNYTEGNVSEPYPIKPYCNVRVCTGNDAGKYTVLEYNRPRSGICFYVLYLIDCLLKHLNIGTDRNDMLGVEDMCRLAFFSTKCEMEEKGDAKTLTIADVRSFMGNDFHLSFFFNNSPYNTYNFIVDETGFGYSAKDVYATNGNMPDVDIEDLFEDLKNAFGIRYFYDDKKRIISFVFIKNILTGREFAILDAEILDVSLIKEKPKKIVFGYGEDEDTAYNYDDYSNVKEMDSYLDILKQGVSSYDTTCYIDRTTGNAYRIKVDKNTGGNPSLFEVGGFRDYSVGEGGDEDRTEELSINFTPVVINDTNGKNVLDGANNNGTEGEQVLAAFADVELKSDENVVFDPSNFIPSINALAITMGQPGYPVIRTYLEYKTKENYERTGNDSSPLATYDAGYTLGIMRGPGNASGIEIMRSNYDGENNDSWVQTVANYAFTADSCDNFGRFFDYNGTEEGGVDQSGRFSLKLVAEKEGYPIGDNYRNRGLVSKFLSEYLYFMAHKKTVMLTVKMSITQIINIDFLKRYRIGNYVGFINKVSYSLTPNGIEDITIELYTL